MSDADEPIVAGVVRIATPGHPAFQLRKGEEGLSVFDPDGVEPPLAEEEIVDAFRPGSMVLYRTLMQIKELGLDVIVCDGVDSIPERLRIAHREVRPNPRMSRTAFKSALKELE